MARGADTPGSPLRLADALDQVLAELDQPLIPPESGGFPVQGGVDAARLHDDLATRLATFDAAVDDNPFANPIQRLALDLSRRMEHGEIGHSAIEQLVQRLSAQAFAVRADRLADYLGLTERSANEAALRALFEAQAVETGVDGAPARAPFESFKARVESELFGVVFTAHPTFNLRADLLASLAELATRRDAQGAALDRAALDERLRRIALRELRPPRAITLDDEHTLSMTAIANAHAALRRVYEIVLETARGLYPQNWRQLTPRMMTVASWVGYDLDGRADISWSQTFEKRLRVQAGQLAHYAAVVAELRDRHARAPKDEDLRHTLDLIESRINLALRESEDEIAGFAARSAADGEREHVQALARRMYASLPRRLVDVTEMVDLINRAVGLVRGPAAEQALCVLRAEVANHGLGLAHTHVRLNASQVHNAIRKQIGMDTGPDDPTSRNTYLAAVNRLIDEVEPVSVNFGSVLAERASAKRLFMVVAQMLKYVDQATPARFLIAECDAPFTVLAALYYARLFGVAAQVDISPLFETRAALEHGHEVIDALLEQPHYLAYVRMRGRLCIQTGFSDAGRYLGQTAAAVAIDRLRMKIGEAVAKRGLDGVQLVIFDTHGESIGRGCHPASFVDRLNYVSSPASRARFRDLGVTLKEETSFQGGDGYLYFITPDIAFASVCRIMEHALGDPPPGEGGDDPFYDGAHYADEFYTTVRHFNAEVMDDPDYAALLSAFGPNLLYKTGSRPIRRQHEYGDDGASVHASQVRAIPHNAILQQMGMLANTLGGLGQAVRRDPDRFRALYADSPRFRRLIGMVEYARLYSDPDVLKAYVDTMDPGLWLLRAGRERDHDRAEALRRLVDGLERLGVHAGLTRIYRKLRRDCIDLDEALAALREEAAVAAAGALVDKRARANLRLLHAIRLTLIQRIYLLAVKVPDFSNQHDATPEQLLAHLLHLDVTHALALLNLIFPRTESGDFADEFGEPASYRSEDAQSYLMEHINLFQPMERLYTLVRRISSAVAFNIGALG